MPICPPLSSIRCAPEPELSPAPKRGPRMMQAGTSHFTYPVAHPSPPPSPPSPSEDQMRAGCSCEPEPDTCPRSTFELLKEPLSVAQTGFLAGERTESAQGRGYTAKSQNISSKLISSCAIISCSFFFFLLQINSRRKTQDSPINNERGKKKSSSWLEFNKSTSPSGLGLRT